MNPELDAALVRDFPALHRNRHLDFRVFGMGRGFEVGDGWEPLIRGPSEKLEPLVVGTDAYVSYIKEKWGLLRFRIWGETRDDGEAKRLITEAEEASAEICGRCRVTKEIFLPYGSTRGGCGACLELRTDDIDDDRDFEDFDEPDT